MPTGYKFNTIEESYLAERLRKIKHASKNERNLEFDIDLSYIIYMLKEQNYKCALTGWDLEFTKGGTWKSGMNPKACSMDRKDSTKGYVKGNIHLVCAQVNIIKTNLDLDYFVDMCKAIASNY